MTIREEDDAPIRVVVIDDDPMMLELHRAHLERIGGFVVAAECRSAREAVATLLDPATSPDLVLLDVTMPDATGLEVLRRVRAGGLRCDVIAVSGVRDAEVVRGMVALGAVQYLIKPYTFGVFRTRIEAYRDFHRRVRQSAGPTTQREVDAMFAAMRPAHDTPLPKGLAEHTLVQVSDTIRESGPYTAREVADRLGLSREVSRRYLEHLADTRRVERNLRYGTRGRPQNEYRWNLDPSR